MQILRQLLAECDAAWGDALKAAADARGVWFGFNSQGEAMGKDAMIDALIADRPSYIRELLESEDERFGCGSLADRYAGTFMQPAPPLNKSP